MTEDRLTYLLTEATELSPSHALRDRVERACPPLPSGSLPLSRGGRQGGGGFRLLLAARLEGRRSRTLPWFALSGVAATLAIVAFLALPRPASAAELLKRADEALRLNVVYRSEMERRIDGRWQKMGTFYHAPDRTLARLQSWIYLRTLRDLYLRFESDGPLLHTQKLSPKSWDDDLEGDPRPAAFAHRFPLLATRGKATSDLPMSAGEPRLDGGHRVRDVVITVGAAIRLRYVIDTETGLPLRRMSEERKDDVWRTQARSRYTYLGPHGNDAAFAAALRSAPVVDADALCKSWEKRLARVRRTVRSTNGKVLEIRDLRTLPNGDVLLLYTGTPRVEASLEGPHGELFAPCWFEPNFPMFTTISVPEIHPAGKRLNGLWFTPLHRDRPVHGPLRLRLWSFEGDRPGRPYRSTADVHIEAPLQSAAVPPYRDVLRARPFDAANDLIRTSARVQALSSRWLDLKGRPLATPIFRRPSGPDLTTENTPLFSPYDAARHDPKGAAEAARLLRAYLARPHDTLLYFNQERAAPTLAKLDGWAKGGTP